MIAHYMSQSDQSRNPWWERVSAIFSSEKAVQ